MRRADGFTLVEVLVAIMLLAVGVLSAVAVLVSSQRLSLVAERRTSMAHRAQREIERLQSLPYAQLAMASAPPPSADPANPDYFVRSGNTFQYDPGDATKTEPLAIDGSSGGIPALPASWSDGRLNGSIYDFVTWTTDPRCGPGCPASNDYKRLTVVVTIDGAAHPAKPAIVSTVVADPTAAPAGAPKDSVQSPLDSASTTCQIGTRTDGTAILGSCLNGISGTPNDFYLYDTSTLNTSTGADVTTRQPITGDHPTHPTGQDPNLMGTDAPPTSTPLPPLYNYSSDVTGDTYLGGQVVKRDGDCSSSPTWSDPSRGAFFTTSTLASNVTLNGSGGATLYLQSATGAANVVTICLGIYAAPGNVQSLATTPPVQLGVLALAGVSIPTVPAPVSFNFSAAFGTSSGQPNTSTIPAGKRVGIRVWLGSSTGDVAFLYDHPEYPSVVQVNSP